MSQIHIARYGQSLGSFSEEEVRQGIASKRFLKGDLAWKVGMTEWRPIVEIEAVWKNDGSSAGAVEAAAIISPALAEPAWERCSGLGYFKAFFQTLCAVLFYPKKTFSKMPIAGKFWRPLFYYGVAWSLPMMLETIVGLPHVFHEKIALLSPEKLAFISSPSSIVIMIIAGIILSLILIPLLMLISCIPAMVGMFFWSSLTYGIFRILAVTKKPLGATVRMMCYALGSLSFIQLIPSVGRIIFIFLGMIFCLIGFKESYHLSGWRAMVAMLVPFLLLILFWLGSEMFHVQDFLLYFFHLK